MNGQSAAKAQKLRDLLMEMDPLIEEYTSRVCPDCTDVCCKQKRGIPEQDDKAYIAALGMPLPVYDAARPPEGPCQFMGSAGCVTPRWLRPWRCTWYFCDPLLNSLNMGPQKKARKLSALIRDIVELRSGL